MDAIQALVDEVRSATKDLNEVAGQLREAKEQQLTEIPDKDAMMALLAPEIKAAIEEAMAANAGRPSMGDEPKGHPFKSFADFCGKVVSGEAPREFSALNSPTIQMAQTTSATAGGYLVPDEFKAQILEIALEQSIVRPRATVIPMETDSLKMPAWNQENHSTNFYGGVLGYWVSEGGPISDSDAAVKEVALGVNALAGLNYQSLRLLKASPLGVSALLEGAFGGVIAFMEDQAFIDGAGTTQPRGIIGSDCEVAVNRSGGASTIVAADVVTMYSKFMGSLDRAVWLANRTTFPQLFGLKDANDNNIWMPNIGAGAPQSLLGIPIVYTEKASALGTKGDLILADFGYYLIGDLGELAIDYSEHVRFANLEGAMRIYKWVDGKPWMSTTYTPRKGTALSPFVVLN
jgi:HK97 family phage major capsid protein